jgi:hypothetical protein
MQRSGEILARFDPFEVAQAIERYVYNLDGAHVRTVLIEARERLGAYYRAELLRLLHEQERGVHRQEGTPEAFASAIGATRSTEALQSALVRFLKSNLRAIALFGPAFSAGVVALVRTNGAIGMGEERVRWSGALRASVITGVALALLAAGAAGEQVLSSQRSASTAPQPVGPPQAVALSTPVPSATLRAKPAFVAHKPTKRASARRALAISLPLATPAASLPQPQPRAIPAQASAPPLPRRAAVATKQHPPKQRLPVGAAVATVRVAPAAQPSAAPFETTDLPRSYNNATPLPSQTVAPVHAPAAIAVPTLKPPPRRRPGWFKRTLKHLDPFKPYRPKW